MMGRVRKALYAAGSAALTTGIAAMTTAGPHFTRDEVATVLGATIAAAVLAGIGTYSVRNTGTVNGSDPLARGTV